MKHFYILLFVLLYSKLYSQQKPTVIIQITVENMRYDDLRRYWNKFSDSGFKKIVDSGTFFVNAHYNYLNINSASGYATLSCGSYPSEHGIVGITWFDRISNKIQNCIEDNNYKTIGGNSTGKSPFFINSLTWTDQLRLSTFKMSKVYSVGITDFSSILIAGKLANAAFWFDIQNSNFVTSSFYGDSIKQWVKDFNNKKFADIYLTKNWETTYEISKYTESLSDATSYEKGLAGQTTFPYNLSQLRNRYPNYSLLLYTPYSNTLVKDFAINLIMNEYLGRDTYTDVLFVNFSAISYAEKYYSAKSVEIEDIFIKLDKDIAHLINFVENYVGKENVLFVLTSDKGSCENIDWLKDININTGILDPNKTVLLSSTYLRAVYGLDDWVVGLYNNQIYLNSFNIDKNKLSISEMQENCTKIIGSMTGISVAIPTSKLFESSYSAGIMGKARNSYFSRRSGDLFIELNYGWRYTNEATDIANCTTSSNDNNHVPIIFYGYNIKKQTIYRETSMDELGVTLSFLLNIPLPTKSTGKPMQEVLENFN